ncbi:MAG TPA: Spy/CpxP family protein refolding chaperone [Thermoanaerobaculia bacterium]
MQSILAIAFVLMSSGYANLTSRAIKALSAEDVQSLREGKGMGLALAAELNAYPGPKHVLELADKLELTTDQRAAVQSSHDRMLATAKSLGAEIVELEKQLDDAFSKAVIDEKRLADLTSAIAERQGRLRYAHLAAHLDTRAALTPHQIVMYGKLRGYSDGAQPAHHGHH